MEPCNANLKLLAVSDNYKYWLQLQLLACSTEGGYMGNWHSGWIAFRWEVLKLSTVKQGTVFPSLFLS